MRAFQPVKPVASVGFLTDGRFTMQSDYRRICTRSNRFDGTLCAKQLARSYA